MGDYRFGFVVCGDCAFVVWGPLGLVWWCGGLWFGCVGDFGLVVLGTMV